MTTANPGAISPEFSLGYLILAIRNYFCLSGVILILCMNLELLTSLSSDS
jgi:hypothetical protein